MTQSRSPVLKTRELDALIAEKVMGWTRPPKRNVTWYRADGAGTSEDSIPRYSSEIPAAFLVVAQMHERHFRTAMEWGGDEGPRWHVTVRSDGYRPFQDESWTADAKELPIAICSASLKALGFSPPEGVQR